MAQIEAFLKAFSSGGGQTICIINIPEDNRGIARPVLVKGSNNNRRVIQKPRQRKYAERVEDEVVQMETRSRSPKRDSKESSRAESAEEDDYERYDRPQTRSYYKTKICNRWLHNDCPNSMSQCKFAHGDSDRREAPEPIICIPFKTTGKCEYGSRCRNTH